jgi:hypothetical protein
MSINASGYTTVTYLNVLNGDAAARGVTMHVKGPSHTQIAIGTSLAGGVAQLVLESTAHSYDIRASGTNFELWDNNLSARRMYVDVNGGVGITNDIYVPTSVRGGVNDAGTLRAWNTANLITFQWASAGLGYRIDNTTTKYICTQTNAQALNIIGGQAGPTGVGMQLWDLANTGGTIYLDGWSDPRLKSNVTTSAVDALAEINKINVVSFDWIEPAMQAFGGTGTDPHIALGLDAAQLRDIIPEMVGVGAASQNGIPADPLIVNLKAGVPWLIKAVQQLSTKVATLEARA